MGTTMLDRAMILAPCGLPICCNSAREDAIEDAALPAAPHSDNDNAVVQPVGDRKLAGAKLAAAVDHLSLAAMLATLSPVAISPGRRYAGFAVAAPRSVHSRRRERDKRVVQAVVAETPDLCTGAFVHASPLTCEFTGRRLSL